MMQPHLQHRGRELIHAMGLLAQCLQLPAATAAERSGWWRDIRRSRVDLEALYVAGLPRDFLNRP